MEVYNIPVNNKIYKRDQGEWIEKDNNLILTKQTELYIQATGKGGSQSSQTANPQENYRSNPKSEFKITMQNARGIPALSGNIKKTDYFERFIRKEQPSIMTIMESGLYDNKKADMPL